MARTPIAPEVVPTGTPLTAEPVVWVPADVANGNSFAWTGKEILLIWNSGASIYTYTFQSVAVLGRQDPIHNIAQNLAVGAIAMFNLRGEGWKQLADNTVYVSASNVAVQFMVIRTPA